MPVKNQSFLVDVFAELAKNDSRYHLLLIGDGAMRTEIGPTQWFILPLLT